MERGIRTPPKWCVWWYQHQQVKREQKVHNNCLPVFLSPHMHITLILLQVTPAARSNPVWHAPVLLVLLTLVFYSPMIFLKSSDFISMMSPLCNAHVCASRKGGTGNMSIALGGACMRVIYYIELNWFLCKYCFLSWSSGEFPVWSLHKHRFRLL